MGNRKSKNGPPQPGHGGGGPGDGTGSVLAFVFGDALLHLGIDRPGIGDALLLEIAEQLVDGRLQRRAPAGPRSEEHTSELQSLMRISYAVFCLKKKQILS